MKHLFKPLLFAIFCPLFGVAQKYHFDLKSEIWPISAVFAAGMAEGVQDHLAFHNTGTSRFWGQDSWKNKYRDRDPSRGLTFRGRWLVFTTDGYHLMKFTKNLFQTTGIVLKLGQKGKPWWHYIVDGVIYWGVNRAGFNITYELLNRR